MMKKLSIILLAIMFTVSPVLIATPKANAAEYTINAVPGPDYSTWYPMYNLNRIHSAKLEKASKAALVTTILAFLPAKAITFQQFASISAGSLLTQFFVNSDTVDIITYIDYSYKKVL